MTSLATEFSGKSSLESIPAQSCLGTDGLMTCSDEENSDALRRLCQRRMLKASKRRTLLLDVDDVTSEARRRLIREWTRHLRITLVKILFFSLVLVTSILIHHNLRK
jgi:hypothetical protein